MQCLLFHILLSLICPMALSAEFRARREPHPINEFSINLLKQQVRIEKKNTTLSALSAANSLAVLHAIGEQQAKREIEKAINSPSKILSLIPNIKSRQPNGKIFYKQLEYAWTFRAAEGIFSENFEPFKNMTISYRDSINFIKIDFSSSGKSHQTINNWVNNQTEFEIREFIKEDQIPKQTNTLIVNAVSLKGTWKTPFDPDYTHSGSFYFDGNSSKVTMMSKKRIKISCHLEKSGLVSIGLPYGVPDIDSETVAELALIVIMPGKDTTLADFIEKSSIASLQAVMPREKQEVELEFPRFKSLKNTISLKKALQSMGIQHIFTRQNNQYPASGYSQHKVDDILHHCFLAISETGTEPLPSTPPKNKSMIVKEELSIQSDLPKVCVNRPFMWFIYDMRNSCIVFIGAQFTPDSN